MPNRKIHPSASSPYTIGDPGIRSVDDLMKVLGNKTETLVNGSGLTKEHISNV